MHYLYFAYSNLADRYYIGESNNITERLEMHNQHVFKRAYTKIASDWKMVFQKELDTRKDALFLEKYIKRMKSRKFIEKILFDPSILDNILEQKRLAD